jgi:hypothetical protein
MLATCPSNLIFLSLIILIIFGENTNYGTPHYSVFSVFQILFSMSCSQTPSVCVLPLLWKNFTPIQNNRQNSMEHSSVISYDSVELVSSMPENVSVCNVRGWYDECCVHALYLYTKLLSITAWRSECSQMVRDVWSQWGTWKKNLDKIMVLFILIIMF